MSERSEIIDLYWVLRKSGTMNPDDIRSILKAFHFRGIKIFDDKLVDSCHSMFERIVIPVMNEKNWLGFGRERWESINGQLVVKEPVGTDA